MDRRFGFLSFEGMEELDLIGPWEMAGMWHDFASGPEIVTVGPKAGLVTCGRGLHLDVHYDYFNCPSLDYLLVPGGKGARTERYNAATIEFIREFFNHGDFLISICTGILILYETGLLKGKQVTTYHLLKEELRNWSDIQIINARYHRDGKLWSSAGISAGMDLMLAFVAHVAGEETAGQIQYLIEYYPEQKFYSFYQSAPKYESIH
jgi:transcriptional regulator GlxA family with amidase domain